MPEGGSSPRFWHGSRCPKDLTFACPSAIHHAFNPVRSNSHVSSCWCILVPVPLFPIVRIGNAISSWRIRGINLNLFCQIDRLSLPTNPCSKPSSCWPATVNDGKRLLIFTQRIPKEGKKLKAQKIKWNYILYTYCRVVEIQEVLLWRTRLANSVKRSPGDKFPTRTAHDNTRTLKQETHWG